MEVSAYGIVGHCHVGIDLQSCERSSNHPSLLSVYLHKVASIHGSPGRQSRQLVMRILVENGSYSLLNMGDVAMLQVAVARLSSLWPDALIEVITDKPNLLAEYCPNAHPIPARGRHTWFQDGNLFGYFYRFGSNAISQHLLKREREIR